MMFSPNHYRMTSLRFPIITFSSGHLRFQICVSHGASVYAAQYDIRHGWLCHVCPFRAVRPTVGWHSALHGSGMAEASTLRRSVLIDRIHIGLLAHHQLRIWTIVIEEFTISPHSPITECPIDRQTIVVVVVELFSLGAGYTWYIWPREINPTNTDIIRIRTQNLQVYSLERP